MSRKIALAVLIVVVSGALVWNFQEAVLDFIERGRDAALDPARRGSTGAPTVRKTLYFAGAEEDLLAPYPVEVEIGKNNIDTLRNLLAALIEGPREEGYAPILPKGTRLRVAFPGSGGIVYVDFDESLRDAHPGGAWAELMTAYGVANTVIKNFPDLFDRVVLLIGGQEAHSIAGSLAITGPLKARDELIAKRGASPGKADASPTTSNETEAGGAPPTPAGSPPTRDAARLPGEKIPPVGSAPVEAVGVPKSKSDVGAVGAPAGAPENSR